MERSGSASPLAARKSHLKSDSLKVAARTQGPQPLELISLLWRGTKRTLRPAPHVRSNGEVSSWHKMRRITYAARNANRAVPWVAPTSIHIQTLRATPAKRALLIQRALLF